MFTKNILIAGFAMIVGATSLASAADQSTRLVFIGGHNPSSQFQVVQTQDAALSYSITGEGLSRAPRYAPITVGSRVVGLQSLSR